MDLVDYSKEVFDKIVAEYKEFISGLNIPDVTCIPLSALEGDNVVEKSEKDSLVRRQITFGLSRNSAYRP